MAWARSVLKLLNKFELLSRLAFIKLITDRFVVIAIFVEFGVDLLLLVEVPIIHAQISAFLVHLLLILHRLEVTFLYAVLAWSW